MPRYEGESRPQHLPLLGKPPPNDFLSMNIRGFNFPDSQAEIKELVRRYSIEAFSILETKD